MFCVGCRVDGREQTDQNPRCSSTTSTTTLQVCSILLWYFLRYVLCSKCWPILESQLKWWTVWQYYEATQGVVFKALVDFVCILEIIPMLNDMIVLHWKTLEKKKIKIRNKLILTAPYKLSLIFNVQFGILIYGNERLWHNIQWKLLFNGFRTKLKCLDNCKIWIME